VSARLIYLSRLRNRIKAAGCDGELRDLNGTLAGLSWIPRADSTAAQITLANSLLATTEAELDTWERTDATLNLSRRAKAKANIETGVGDCEKMARAMLMAMNDAVNQTNARLNAVLDAIDANSTYAALRTAVAAINNLPTRTDLQAKNAVLSRIDDGSVD
jgi:hypothetical protein